MSNMKEITKAQPKPKQLMENVLANLEAADVAMQEYVRLAGEAYWERLTDEDWDNNPDAAWLCSRGFLEGQIPYHLEHAIDEARSILDLGFGAEKAEDHNGKDTGPAKAAKDQLHDSTPPACFRVLSGPEGSMVEAVINRPKPPGVKIA